MPKLEDSENDQGGLDPEQFPAGTSRRHDERGRVCRSYLPGHNTHMMSALRQHRESAQVPVQVKLIPGVGFRVTTSVGKPGLQGEICYCHNPRGLMTAIAAAASPEAVQLVRGSTFITVFKGEGTAWFYMSRKPQTPCVFE